MAVEKRSSKARTASNAKAYQKRKAKLSGEKVVKRVLSDKPSAQWMRKKRAVDGQGPVNEQDWDTVGWCVLRKSWRYCDHRHIRRLIHEDVEKIRKKPWFKETKVQLNGDPLKLMYKLSWFCKRVQDMVIEVTNDQAGVEVLKSLANCHIIVTKKGASAQRWHIDSRFPDKVSVLHYLSNRTFELRQGERKITLDLKAGDIVKFKTKICHRGTAHTNSREAVAIHVAEGYNPADTFDCAGTYPHLL